MFEELIPPSKRLNNLLSQITMNQYNGQSTIQPNQTDTQPTQNTYAQYASQFPMAEMANPYGDYSSMRSRFQQNQTAPVSQPSAPISQPSTPVKGSGAPSGKGANAIAAGQKFIGNSKYVWGAGRKQSDIENGRFDCSGFVNYAFKQAGVDLGSGNTDTIAKKGVAVSPSQMQPGDIVFFDTYKKNGHVGIYIGNGKFIGSQSKTGVAVADMTSGYYKKKFNGNVRRV
jgi:cell wall-associated NlpC family hydrolase